MTEHRCPTGYHYMPSAWCAQKHKCRCSDCKALYVEYVAADNMKRGLSRGRRRRAEGQQAYQAMVARMLNEGWTMNEISRQSGIHSDSIRALKHRRGWISETTARKLSKLFYNRHGYRLKVPT